MAIADLIIARGERRCRTCGEVHDCYAVASDSEQAGRSWADPKDGHVYDPESWETIARRLGFERGV